MSGAAGAFVKCDEIVQLRRVSGVGQADKLAYLTFGSGWRGNTRHNCGCHFGPVYHGGLFAAPMSCCTRRAVITETRMLSTVFQFSAFFAIFLQV